MVNTNNIDRYRDIMNLLHSSVMLVMMGQEKGYMWSRGTFMMIHKGLKGFMVRFRVCYRIYIIIISFNA